MKYKLFGKNIVPDCSYCENSISESGVAACKKNRSIKDGKCRSFDYNPLLREPKSVSILGSYTAEDFKI